jgi:hypothetical protein
LRKIRIIGVLKEHELGAKTADLCHKRGTLYGWKSKFGGLNLSEAKQLKRENARPKKLLSMLDNAALRDSLVKQEAVAHFRQAHKMSERRTCLVIGCVRMTVRYRSRRADDVALRERLRTLAGSVGALAITGSTLLLRRGGFIVNHKRLFRIYREERLMVRKRGGRKRALQTRAPIPVPLQPNERFGGHSILSPISWLAVGAFRVLAIVYDCNRECLAAVADTSLSGTRVACELDRVSQQAGGDRRRQRDRANQQRHSRLGRSNPSRLALHCAWQADAKRLRRKLQRPLRDKFPCSHLACRPVCAGRPGA